MRTLLTVALAMLLAACSASSSHVLTGIARTPIAWQSVKLYREPPAGFEEIAMLDALDRFGSEQNRTDDVIEALKREAAALGANGVLLTDLGYRAVSGGYFQDGTGTTGTAHHRTARAIAIHVPAQ